MFTSCGVMSGQSHYLPRDVVRPHPGLEFNRQLHLEVGGAPGSCLTYQTPVYNNPPAQPSVASNALNLSASTMAQPPPPPPPPPLPAPPASAAGPPGGPKLGQGGFKKICRTEEDGPSPFPGLAPGVLEMRVKEGSKIRNLMGFAMARMQSEKADGGGGASAGAGGLRQVVFTGSGRAVTKTITCAEIMKRKVGALHQLTKLRYKGVKEVWESHDGGASEMTVHRTVPSISILLSKDPLDPWEPGYQPPETLSALWEEREGADTQQPTASKRPLGQTPSGGYPDCKRACFGEGGSVVPPSLSG